MPKGLIRGFQLIGEWLRMVWWAVMGIIKAFEAGQSVDPWIATLKDILQVGDIWAQETFGIAANAPRDFKDLPFKVGTWAILFGDPWKDSRTALQAAQLKWGKH